MKHFILTFLLATSLLIVYESGQAQDRGFGVGAVMSGPDGVSYKAWLSDSAALAGALSFTIAENNSTFYTHVDYLMHKPYDLDWEVGILQYYYGGGISVLWRELQDNSIVGLRFPSGFAFNFSEVPVDLFFELAPTIDVSPDFRFAFNGALGFRFFLN